MLDDVSGLSPMSNQDRTEQSISSKFIPTALTFFKGNESEARLVIIDSFFDAKKEKNFGSNDKQESGAIRRHHQSRRDVMRNKFSAVNSLKNSIIIS